MSDVFRSIRLSDIDADDDRYRIQKPAEASPYLANSLNALGVIAPPVVRPEKNRYIIISGFNRIRALQAIQAREVAVLIKDETLPDSECLMTALADLAFRRPLSLAELIQAIQKLSVFFDIKTMSERSPAVFNTRLSTAYIEDLLGIGAMPGNAIDLIQSDNLAFKTARKICRLEKDAINVFLKIFSSIRVSLNIQLEIVRNMIEISAREGIGIRHLFEMMEIGTCLESKDPSDPVSAARQIRARVFERRYPTLFKARQTISDRIRTLNLPESIRICAPEYFESRGLQISISAVSPEECLKDITILKQAMDTDDLKALFS